MNCQPFKCLLVAIVAALALGSNVEAAGKKAVRHRPKHSTRVTTGAVALTAGEKPPATAKASKAKVAAKSAAVKKATTKKSAAKKSTAKTSAKSKAALKKTSKTSKTSKPTKPAKPTKPTKPR